jgi:hypothetical protein
MSVAHAIPATPRAKTGFASIRPGEAVEVFLHDAGDRHSDVGYVLAVDTVDVRLDRTGGGSYVGLCDRPIYGRSKEPQVVVIPWSRVDHVRVIHAEAGR